jgi:hypothetical protein
MRRFARLLGVIAMSLLMLVMLAFVAALVYVAIITPP